MNSNIEIILGLSFIYLVHTILYKREKPLTRWEIFTLFCVICWMVLILDHLYHKVEDNVRGDPQPSMVWTDPDKWDGTYVYPDEASTKSYPHQEN